MRLNSHKNLTATLHFLDNDEWLLQYDNIEYGVHLVKFKLNDQKVASVEIRANEFVEFDPYTFTKTD